jgi:2-polyprenyl-6-methoxyphenol hydroxylase-like FAD-dependent oxidoreductase
LLIGADGAHSAVRKGLGIELVDQSGTLQQLVNVHFFSRSLAERLRKTMPAMLYFIYSPAGVGVVVAHALSRGEFVAQIPFFPPLQPFSAFDGKRCVQLIQQWIGREMTVQVKSIRQWSMRVALSDRFRSQGGRCFLVGDAAHQFTPAGGFGMNTGIQDAHNLIWKIALARKLEKAGNNREADRLLSTYESERRPVAVNNARWSIENYEQTLAVPRALGLNPFLGPSAAPSPRSNTGSPSGKAGVFCRHHGAGMKQINWLRSDHFIARYRQRKLDAIFKNAKSQTLQLLFPGQDLGFIYAPAGSTGNSKHAAAGRPV